jgi:bifunctional non-homologous end joining protein LigD
LQAALSEGHSEDLIYFAFDLLFLKGQDFRGLGLKDRKSRLQAMLPSDEPYLRYVEHFETSGDAVWQSACRLELEGIVSKRLDGQYRSGRGEAWMKAKCRGGQEVVIGGWTGEKGRMRSLLAGIYQGDKLIYVGRVGTGFGSDVVRKLLPKLEAARSAKSPFAGAKARGKPPTSTGPSPSWWPRFSSPASPAMEMSARRHSRACARTRRPRTWSLKPPFHRPMPSYRSRLPSPRRRNAPVTRW